MVSIMIPCDRAGFTSNSKVTGRDEFALELALTALETASAVTIVRVEDRPLIYISVLSHR
jgi:hypothetical protein